MIKFLKRLKNADLLKTGALNKWAHATSLSAQLLAVPIEDRVLQTTETLRLLVF